MLPYITLSDYLRSAYQLQEGEKIYKLALSAPCTCPNRDGTKGSRGCIFCSSGGSGEFAQDASLPISLQIEKGKELIRKKAKNARYIAYFQSFSNTYGPVETLLPLFKEAILHPEVAILSIATRPDCLETEMLDALEDLAKIKPVWVELGLQTMHEETAKYIRRGYDLPVFEEAVHQLKKRGISVIVHLILGLPGERGEDMIESAGYVSDLLMREKENAPTPGAGPSSNNCGACACDLYADGVKLQLLHVLRGTDLAEEYDKGTFEVLDKESYFHVLAECIEAIDPSLVLHRVTGDGAKKDLIAPLWSGDKKRVLNDWTKYCKGKTWRKRTF